MKNPVSLSPARVDSDAQGMSLLSVVVALLIIAAVIWLLASRFEAGVGGEDEAAGGPPDLVSSLDHTHQQQTLANMKYVGSLNDLRYAETGRYAERLVDLESRGQRLGVDGWGNSYVYSSDGGTYTLTSLGSDGAAGPSPPEPWPGPPYDPDLVMTAGRFTQAPSGR